MTARLRIATYNICWFSNLFDEESALRRDAERSAMHDVTRARQADAVAEVLRAVDADCFAIIEAPNQGKRHDCVRALEGFATTYGLRQSRALIGFESGTDQEIALLYDPDFVSAVHDPVGLPAAEGAPADVLDPAPRFDGIYALDLDGDGEIDLHRFSKPPLEAAVHWRAAGRDLRLIAVHAKSKAPYGAEDAADAARISLINRRKQLAQCAWLRARIEEHLTHGDAVIALGDFNDGPGLDKYERVFGRSGVEVVMGDPGDPDRLLRNPFVRRAMLPYGARPSTARFYNRQTQGFSNALIDFVMLSPEFARQAYPSWRIWHPFDDKACFEDSALQAALLDASDHFPVSVDLTLPAAGAA
ncbi:MAG: endonuclease/exonuclease/phosphatase family protein [Pseudomonadota bacterium]